jgi:hypothetical protein
MLASARFVNAAFRASAFVVGRPLARQAALPARVPGGSLWVTARGRGGGKEKESKKDAMRGVKKENLPTKVCVVCDRPFTWRKKWERCWDEVTTCSKSCNAARRREKGASAGPEDDDDEDVDARSGGSRNASDGEASARDAKKDARKAAKKAVKAAKRAKRAGASSDNEDGSDASDGSKACDLCDTRVDLLVRCQVDSTKRWKMACGKCWKVASGGVPDGDADHPHYRYGGLWKNRRAASDAGVRNGWKAGGKRAALSGDAAAEGEAREEDLAALADLAL